MYKWLFSEEERVRELKRKNHIERPKRKCYSQISKWYIEDLLREDFRGIPCTIKGEEKSFYSKGYSLHAHQIELAFILVKVVYLLILGAISLMLYVVCMTTQEESELDNLKF